MRDSSPSFRERQVPGDHWARYQDITDSPEFFRCVECENVFWVPGTAQLLDYCSRCEEEILHEARKRERLRSERPSADLAHVSSLACDAFELIQSLYNSVAEVRNRFKRDGYLYLLGGEGYYKIGRTTNVNRRIRQLEIQLPWPVHLEHTIPCEKHKESERELHLMFANRRTNGEWFALTAEDVAAIQAINRMRGPQIDVGGTT